MQFEVVEVVGGGVAGHLSAQSDCRVGGVGDRHGQGGSGRQVGRREVHAFGEGASRGEAEVDEFQAEVAVDAAGVGEVLFEGLVLVDDARQKILLEEDLRVILCRPNVVAPRHIRAHGGEHAVLLALVNMLEQFE